MGDMWLMIQGTLSTASDVLEPQSSTFTTSDDFFSDDTNPAPAPVADKAPETAPEATSAPTPEPSASTETNEQTPTADATVDEWATLDIDEGDGVDTPAAEPLAEVAKVLGLDAVPKTAEELAAATEEIIQRRVSELTFDPIRQIDTMLGLSNRELVRADLNNNRSRYDTDETIETRLDQLEAEDRIDAIGDEIRAELNGKRETFQQERAVEAQRIAQLRQQAQTEMWQAAQQLKDPEGKPLPASVQKYLYQYTMTQQYMNDLLAQDAEWHLRNAARLNPKVGPMWQQKEAKVAELRGASNVYRELEHQTPAIGSGSAISGGETVVGADGFFD